MSQLIPQDRPLSAQNREYLLSRNEIAMIERIDAMHGVSEEDGGADEVLPYDQWSVDDLRAEIDDRNKAYVDAGSDTKISKAGSRADMAARLDADDAAKAA